MKMSLSPGTVDPRGAGAVSVPLLCGHSPASTRTKLVLPLAFRPEIISAEPGVTCSNDQFSVSTECGVSGEIMRQIEW